MSMDKLANALGDVQDEFIRDAHAGAVVKRFSWVKWAAAAACAVIAVLIAVPALWGKAPKVEPEPVEVTEPEPADEPEVEPVDEPEVEPADEPEIEPVDEPEVEPADEPVDEPVPNEPESETIWVSQSTGKSLIPIEFHILTTDEPMETSLSGSEAGGVAGGPYTYEMFLRDYAAVTSDPVYAKLFATQEIRDAYQIYEVSSWDDLRSTGKCAVLDIKGYSGPFGMASKQSVYIELIVQKDGYANDSGFDGAKELGVRVDFVVDGITVEKFRQKDSLKASDSFWYEIKERSDDFLIWERVYYNGNWYELYGESEEDLDFVASAMAHAISTL